MKLARRSSPASTDNAVTAVPCRGGQCHAARYVTLIDALLTVLCRNRGSKATVTRSSARDGVNSAVLARCSPFVNDATQNFTLNRVTAEVAVHDSRCLLVAGNSTAAGATGSKTTLGPCPVGPETAGPGGGGGKWTLNGDGTLSVSAGTAAGGGKSCLVVVTPPTAPTALTGPYTELLPCSVSSTKWRFVLDAAAATAHATDAGGEGSAAAVAGTLVVAGEPAPPSAATPLLSSPKTAASDTTTAGLCLTAVEPSFVMDVAATMQISDAATDAAVPGAVWEVLDDRTTRVSFSLQPGQTVAVMTSVMTSFDTHGPDFAQEPLVSAR